MTAFTQHNWLFTTHPPRVRVFPNTFMPPPIKSTKSFQYSKQPPYSVHPCPCRYNTNLYQTNTIQSTNLPKSLLPSQSYIPSKNQVVYLFQVIVIFQSLLPKTFRMTTQFSPIFYIRDQCISHLTIGFQVVPFRT